VARLRLRGGCAPSALPDGAFASGTHLVDVRVGYTAGAPSSWREVPPSGLQGLLREVVKNRVDQTPQPFWGCGHRVRPLGRTPPGSQPGGVGRPRSRLGQGGGPGAL